MTEQDRGGRPSRPRPSYGLPGPDPVPSSSPDPSGQPPSSQAPSGRSVPGQLPSEAGHPASALPPPQFAASPGSSPRRGRRRGLIPLLLGLLGMFVLAPAALIIGGIFAFSGLTDLVMDGPMALEDGTAKVPASAGQMYIVYVPEAEAEAATCTAEGTSGEAVTTIPSSSTVTFPDGKKYQQKMGAMAIQDTDVTISCKGISDGQAAYLGPISAKQLGLPLLLGFVGSVVFGVVGLVLVIIGILRLVRSRRS